VAGHADVARALIEAVNRRDLQAALAVADPAIVIEPLSTEAAERMLYVGHASLPRYMQEIDATWERLEFEIEQVRERGRYVVLNIRARAKARVGGFEADQPIGMLLRMRGDRVAGLRVYADPEEAIAEIELE
jgi:ketosteroid isomerase-like protein